MIYLMSEPSKDSDNDAATPDPTLDGVMEESAASYSPDETEAPAALDTEDPMGQSITSAEPEEPAPPKGAQPPAATDRKSAKSPPVDVLAQAIAVRERDVSNLLASKENLQLDYVFKKVPKAFYLRWKAEGNFLFTLMVRLRQRRVAIKKRQTKAG